MITYKIVVNDGQDYSYTYAIDKNDLKDINVKVTIFIDELEIDSMFYTFDNYKEFAKGKGINLLTLKGYSFSLINYVSSRYGFTTALDIIREFDNSNILNDVNLQVKDYVTRNFAIKNIETKLIEKTVDINF